MRRIETEEVRESRRKRNTALVSFVMLLILVFGTVGFAFSYNSGQDDEVDNDEENIYGDYWSLEVGGATLYFTHGPEEIGDVPIEIRNLLGNYGGEPLYVSGDILFLREIELSLGKFVSKLQEACYGECERDLPEKDCSEESNLIVFKDADENRVYQEENCVFIEGDLRAVDAFIYKLLGVE